MITSNPKAHMSPRDLTRLLASEVQTMPGFSLNDKAFHASVPANRDYFLINTKIYHAIQSYFLGQGHTLEQWQVVADDLKNSTGFGANPCAYCLMMLHRLSNGVL